MTEVKIGYKVIAKENNTVFIARTSAVVWGRGMIHYPRNITVYPSKGCGPLCIFDTKEAALKFTGGTLQLFIVKCEYTSHKGRLAIWEGQQRITPASELPSGTILASSVTCLE